MKALVYCLLCPPHWIKTPPLGLEFIKNYSKKRKIEVKIIDLNILCYKLLGTDKRTWLSLDKKFEENLFSLIKRKHPQIIKNIFKKLKNANLIGFSLYKRNRPFTFSFIEEVKSAYPKKKIVIGGPEVLFMKMRKEYLNDNFSWVIGEGEKSIERILNSSKEKIIIHDELENLDEIPFCEFNDCNIEFYSSMLPLYSSRGCIRRCKFCAEKFLTVKFRQHSPLYLTEQINFLVDKYKINNFVFQDSLINGNLNWLEEFCSLILRKNLKISWEAQLIVKRDFTKDLARLLKKSGCFNLFIGLESASNKVLEAMNKGFTKEEALALFKILKKENLHFEVSLIVGFPQEEKKDFQETAEFIVKNKEFIPKIAQINPYIDYFSSNYLPPRETLFRVKKLISILEREKIPHTKSFINNLFYRDGN